MKRFALRVLSSDSTLLVYARDAASAVLKAGRAGYAVGPAVPAGEYDALANIVQERTHVNGANGHAPGYANGHVVKGGRQ